MIDEIIEYLEETYAITDKDLALNDEDRNVLIGQRLIIAELKTIRDKGLPNKKKEEDKK